MSDFMNQDDVHINRGQAESWWKSKAEDIHFAAIAIWNARQPSGQLEQTRKPSKDVFALNAGLSIELLLKSIIVVVLDNDFENIPYTHDLKKLAIRAKIFHLLDENQKTFLDILSQYIIWLGKYPVGKNNDSTIKTMDILSEIPCEEKQVGYFQVITSGLQKLVTLENYLDLWNFIDHLFDEAIIEQMVRQGYTVIRKGVSE